MTSEAAFITSLRAFAVDPAARGLMDDAAVLDVGGGHIVVTHDMIVEGVHYLTGDPPEDIAWKLVAVNLSDLAAKGARPLGVLLGYPLADDAAWDGAFAKGLKAALAAFDVALLGGDTVAAPAGPRALGLTAIGLSDGEPPSRAGARPGEMLWVSGTIGDAGAGLRIAAAGGTGPLPDRYRRPVPRLALGQALAPLASAMMDVSDGLLIDAARLAAASEIALSVDLDAVPLSGHLRAIAGEGRAARLEAATAGDDYELLFTAPRDAAGAMADIADRAGVALTAIGAVAAGAGLSLHDAAGALPLPARLGYTHERRSGA